LLSAKPRRVLERFHTTGNWERFGLFPGAGSEIFGPLPDDSPNSPRDARNFPYMAKARASASSFRDQGSRCSNRCRDERPSSAEDPDFRPRRFQALRKHHGCSPELTLNLGHRGALPLRPDQERFPSPGPHPTRRPAGDQDVMPLRGRSRWSLRTPAPQGSSLRAHPRRQGGALRCAARSLDRSGERPTRRVRRLGQQLFGTLRIRTVFDWRSLRRKFHL
jgi:hypothetical protein